MFSKSADFGELILTTESSVLHKANISKDISIINRSMKYIISNDINVYESQLSVTQGHGQLSMIQVDLDCQWPKIILYNKLSKAECDTRSWSQILSSAHPCVAQCHHLK